MPADHVHFNGSVNLADAESVMREIASRVPSGLRRIPDGETGDRGNWIFFQLQKFLQLPWLVPDRPVGEADGEYEQLPRLRLAEGADPGQVTWPDIGYADAYLESYRVFAGLHFCYGDYGHQHFMQPASLALQVRVLNAVTAAALRRVSFVSFTVPQYQRDESYFAPLAGLAADPDTELNFALVPYHPAEQEAGTTADQVRLIDAALAASPGGPRAWGICTECGMGRVDRGDVPALLDLHREIIAVP